MEHCIHEEKIEIMFVTLQKTVDNIRVIADANIRHEEQLKAMKNRVSFNRKLIVTLLFLLIGATVSTIVKYEVTKSIVGK